MAASVAASEYAAASKYSSSSKYANLPDIDVGQPDVYETPDVPDTEDQYGNEAFAEQPLSEDISVASITANKAAERFRVSSGDIDGKKSALVRYQRSLFRTLQLESLFISASGGSNNDNSSIEVRSGGAAGGSSHPVLVNETPEQRLRRLVYETQELEQQLAANATDSSVASSKQNVALMELVAGLNADLAQLSDKTRSAGSGLVPQALWQRLEAAALAGDDGDKMEVDEARDAVEGGTHGEMRTRSRNTGTASTDAEEGVGQMEARIAALERTLGAAHSLPKDPSVGHALVDTVSRLRKQIEILADPHRVDAIHRRVKQALVDMDRLEAVANAQTQGTKSTALGGADGAKGSSSTDTAGASGAQTIDPAVARRVEETYEKLVGIDSFIELVPATARRLQSLAKLHAQASDVVARIGGIESEQQSIGEELGIIKDIAAGLKTSMADNATVLKDNMRHLDTRIGSLNDRLSALLRN
ncbi:hypothetical protein GGI11_000753 [Coemansia sp. RSA 2049]|nr:hypothetical protein GGI11_000753 [Coemansia sp. RSA 2049]